MKLDDLLPRGPEPGWPNEHGYCPHCGANLDGGSIYETGLKMYDDATYDKDMTREAWALKYARAYGASKTKGQWGRALGIYDRDDDRTVAWRCPDCEKEWKR